METLQTNEIDLITQNINIKNSVLVEVGCGRGDFFKIYFENGAKEVLGVDLEDVVSKKIKFDNQYLKKEYFKVGTAQKLPLEDNFADILTFITSFHHIPDTEMENALKECFRVLKPNGKVFILEPAHRKGNDSYFEILEYIENEIEIQKKGFDVIKKCKNFGLENVVEIKGYFERNLDDYKKLVDKYVEDENKKIEFLEKGKKIFAELTKNMIKPYLKSYLRVNVLQKIK
jgi:ubiquinone/menaquinone biosynthesis C-methylase UbiE